MTTSLILAAALAACPLASQGPDFDAAETIATGDAHDLQAMIACLGDPDPAIRDDGAYRAFAAAMRGDRVKPEQRRLLMNLVSDAVGDAVADGADGGAGYMAPFAVLVMAEIARTDRIDPWLSEDELYMLAEFAGLYMESVSDYRGFVPGEGWRHGVAHAADLMMQLSLNPRMERGTGKDMLGAILEQVAPASHAYRFGEPARLARPVIYLADSEVMLDEEWARWFEAVYPAQEAARADRYTDAEALNRMHNARTFALEIMAMSGRLGDSPAIKLYDLAQEIVNRTKP